MQVWINGDSDENVGKIASDLDAQIAKAPPNKLKGFIVFIPKKGEDTSAVEAKLQKLSDANKLHDVAFVYVSGPDDEAVSDYRINKSPDVKNTVLVYAYHKVNANYVNFKADEKGLEDLNGAIAKMLPK